MADKKTWKKRNLGPERVRAAVRTSRSLSEAARALGVNRSTLHRWLEADPSLKEPIRERQEAEKRVLDSAKVLSPEDWARQVTELCKPDETQRVLIDLAQQTLEIANDTLGKPSERIAAMGRFQQIVKDLPLDKPAAPEIPKPQRAPERQKDPRASLRVV